MKKFENQYLLAKNNLVVKNDYDWREIKFTDFNLTHCPKLKAYEHKAEKVHFVLLGFCFHALNSKWIEQDIVSNIPLDNTELLDYLDLLCGNFLLLIEVDGKLTLFNDPAAALKIFYYIENDIIVCAGPDPSILADNFNLKKHEDEKVLEFYNSDIFKKNLIRLGDKSIYKNTYQVKPNHLLSLDDNKVSRYFPRKKKEDLSIDCALEKVHEYFTNIIDAAASQYEMKCSITAGWDSRIVTSITKDYHDSTEYYTFINPPYKQSHPDLSISKKIAKKLNLNYKQYERPMALSDEEVQFAKDSFVWLEDSNVQQILAGFSAFNKPNQLLLIGNVSEICKNYFEDIKITDGKSFAQAAHFPVLDYTVNHFAETLKELKKIELDYNYDLRDIGHWEQDISNFASMGILYRSLTTKTFSPFNCRILIDTILSIPREYRDKQQHYFYKRYIEKYYPELSEFKINPNLKSQLIVLTKKIGIYKGYKTLSTKLRK